MIRNNIEMIVTFGDLTQKQAVKNKAKIIDYLFEHTNSELKNMSVIDIENQAALENLKKLTIELQTKRLRYKARNACEYFTL